MSSYESLRNAKAAFDDGLISEQDLAGVRTAFLRAQQIKAGLDAGFIQEDDYSSVKQAFMNSLNMTNTDPSAVLDALPPSNMERPQPHLQQSTSNLSSRAPTPPPPQQAAPQNGSRGLHEPRAAESSYTASPAMPAQAPAHTPAPASQRKTLVPTNIPKMGGARPKQSGNTSMSGISVTEDAVNLFYYLKAKSVYRWATWKINDAGNQVIIAEVGDKESTYSEFLDSFPQADCRYGVIDMRFTNSEGCVFNKILFINWAPDTARIKAKMMYASTKDFFKSYLDGLSLELQGSDLDDVSEEEANKAVRGSVTRQ